MILSTQGLGRWVGLVLGAILTIALIARPALAITVTVGGRDYTLSTLGGSFDENAATLQIQPWWGSSDLALQFANQYDALVSTPIDSANLNLFSFYYDESRGAYSQIYWDDDVVFSTQSGAYASPTQTFMYVVPTEVPEINVGSLSQAMLILFAFWLVTRRRAASPVA